MAPIRFKNAKTILAGATAGWPSSAQQSCTSIMERSSVYRKQVQHFDEPNQFRELTFSCYKRMPLLTNDTWRLMLTDSINRAIECHCYHLIAFVYMPEHVHLLVFPEGTASPIDQLLKAIKRPFSYRIKKMLAESRGPLLQKLTVRQRPGVEAFRFWQEGPGYDRNLLTLDAALASANYIHLNPLRRGLVSSELNWRWSSARHFVEPSLASDQGLPLISRLDEIIFV